jgi:C-terminal processing protease CtpA/Prc
MMLQNFPAIAQSSGLIIDVRANGGGSSEYGYAILRMLADKPFANSNWRTLDYRPSFRAWGNVPGWFNGQHDQIPPDPDHHFDKPVAVLIGPRTFSAAEDFVVAFDAMHRGTLIGETTGGSTGQPLLFALPGGGSARICTKDDSYPDGRVFEGVGIPPAISVAPTVGDIRRSTDPVLTRAEQFLQVSPPSP